MSWFARTQGLDFITAWRKVLRGRRVRRAAWCKGVYITLAGYTPVSFVALYYRGGLKAWQPYAHDFAAQDWEVL